MKTFRVWLEEKDNIQDVVLTKLGLDKNTGLGTPLAKFDHDTNGEPFIIQQLEDLGEWKSLPPEKQAAARDIIQQGQGTVGDLIALLSSSGESTEKVGVQPPEGEDSPKPKPHQQPQTPQQPMPPQGQMPAPM